MKKKCALVFGITNNYLFALANTLIGLKNNNKRFWDDIIVYIDKIDQIEKENINKILTVNFCVENENNFKNLKNSAIEKYSVASFFRYNCFRLLDEYETVIWNDVDILIRGDISGLLNYASESGFAATLTMGNFNVEANFKKLILKYNMFNKLYNSGILVLKDNLKNYEDMYDWCIQKTNEYLDILNWPDQGIINILIQEFNINVDQININKYCCHPTQTAYINDASIIHAYGDQKFWNSYELRKKFPKWVEYDNEWKMLEENIEKNEPLVSCIMSTYNRYDYLKDSINSILNQTYKNIELIIVTEKCENQDKICKLIESYNDDRIKIIHNKEKLGFAASLNVGINAAKGKYIARMDDDDISLPDRFAIQVEYLERNPEVGICGTAGTFFGKYSGEIEIETDPEKLKIITLFKTPFIHPTVMMRKEIIKKFDLFYNKDYFTEDYELWSRAANHCKLANINMSLLKYRCSDSNLTSGQNETKIHNSHKKIMFNQIKNNLHLTLSNNEIETIQLRKDIISNSFNHREIVQLRKKVLKKIIKYNKKSNYYNMRVLKSTIKEEFHFENISCKLIIKQIAKKIILPFYSRLMGKVDVRIAASEQSVRYYCDTRIKEIENKNKVGNNEI